LSPTAKTSAPPRQIESPASAPAIEAAIADLKVGANAWSHLTVGQRARLLQRVRATVVANAEEWATSSARTKGLEASHPLAGEEWLGSPYGALVALDGYIATLSKLEKGASPLDGVRLDAAPGDRVRAHVFPANGTDRLLLSGYTGEVWLKPGITQAEAVRSAGLAQLAPAQSGGICLVLGAGNQSSIPVLDVLYELVAANRVALLKVNPTQDDLVPLLERALAPLVELGLLRVMTGGPDVGEYLTQHPDIAHIHITGATSTFDAIVWGPAHGPGADLTAQRRREGKPRLHKSITAELGGVSPIIVVPGRWTDADLTYQAEHISTMRLYNSGHNCIAGQVVIVSADWDQRDAFLAALRTAYDQMPGRPVWYPRADEKLAAAASDYPDATWNAARDRALIEIGPDDDATALERTEYFAPVLGVIQVPGLGQEFLDAAIEHANDRLAGTLGANVLIDPSTEEALGSGFTRAIADLRYGSVAINTWTAFAYLNASLAWGGYPGATLDDVGSGIGHVHNTLLLDHVERSVVRGPFRPFPRSVSAVGGRGIVSVLAKPPWFASSRTAAAVSEGFTRFQMDHDWVRFSRTMLQSLRA